jgi:cysteinyl-tRNA synthetase
LRHGALLQTDASVRITLLHGPEMTAIHLHNTLTNRLQPLDPVHKGEVRMYTCGPTVYDFAHIGNFRTFVFQDVLRRFLQSRKYRVLQVMNLTDVDDRIIQKAAAAGVSIREYTEKYVQAFLQDMDALHLEVPEELVRATDHIEDMVGLIERLQKKRPDLFERRLDLLQHRKISALRTPFKNRSGRDENGRAR